MTLQFPSALAAISLASIVAAPAARGQDSSSHLLDSLLSASSRDLRLDEGTLSGPGSVFLLDEAARAQFLALGEQHNTREIPELTTALFHALQRAGYQYLAEEQDPEALRWASSPAARSRDSVVAFARRYQHGFTFMSDQELAMLGDVAGAARGRGNPLWGCDQAFGATHVLDRLIPLVAGPAARPLAIRLRDWAREKERTRDLAHYHFMAHELKSDSLAALAAAVHAPAGSDADFLIHSLVVSDRVYRNYREGHYYDNGYEREEYMKQRFLDEYRRALAADKTPPRVILKFGHWHVFRGLGPSNLQTLGDFVSQLAIANDSRSFHMAIFPNGEPGAYGDLRAWTDEVPRMLAGAATPAQWTIVDLRPLRPYYARLAEAMKPEARDSLRRWLFGFDAALFVGGMQRATYALNPGVAY